MLVNSLLVASALALAVATPCRAQSIGATGAPLETVTGPQLQELLQTWGYRAEVDRDNEGDPMVRTGISGMNVQIYFYGCTTDTPRRCRSVQLHVGVKTDAKVDLVKVNQWNNKKRYVKVYVADNETGVHAELDVPLGGGASPAYIRNLVEIYETSLADFRTTFVD